MTRLGLGILFSIALLGACGGDTSSPAETGTTLPLCQWPAELDPPNAKDRDCRAWRTYLECDAGGGATLGCVSDNVERCPESSELSSYSNCQNQCTPGEFALVCGGIGPGPNPQPPATCRMVLPTPGGIAFYCCPCGA